MPVDRARVDTEPLGDLVLAYTAQALCLVDDRPIQRGGYGSPVDAVASLPPVVGDSSIQIAEPNQPIVLVVDGRFR